METKFESFCWRLGWLFIMAGLLVSSLTFLALKSLSLKKQIVEKQLENCSENWKNIEPQIKSKRIILELK
uniref:Uncharacterized protein n=1 Tax=viral metagenome TaxID=1070528 RepID=A0A6H2A2N1_9ZZZZ